VKVVFLGTPAFAVPSLEGIVRAGHEIAAVFTQPDRPKGRGQKMAMPPVKESALRLGVAVFQPERVRRPEVVEQLQTIAPEAMVVVGYGQIIPQSILDIPPLGIINVHASLLPKYRGAAPVQWAIARGETITGVTTMRIDAGLDTGDILLKWETQIGEEETAIELGERLAVAGADLLVRTLTQLSAIKPEPQDASQSTLAPILKREDGHVDWTKPSREILNRVRGFQPWPGCYGFRSTAHGYESGRLHIWKAASADISLHPGELRSAGRGLFIGCGDGSIALLEVQPEGKKRMPAEAFLNGNTIEAGEALT
jgi:methionyl-tRNA formyltransferase